MLWWWWCERERITTLLASGGALHGFVGGESGELVLSECFSKAIRPDVGGDDAKHGDDGDDEPGGPHLGPTQRRGPRRDEAAAGHAHVSRTRHGQRAELNPKTESRLFLCEKTSIRST